MGYIDYTLATYSTTMLVIDWAQTRTIRDSNGRLYEKNKLIGEHAENVDVYFPIVVGVNLLTHKLTPMQRKIVWIAVSMVETYMVDYNFKLGIKAQF